MNLIPVGHCVEVRVPATTANLGPGFDCVGLALAWFDDLAVTREKPGHGLRIDVEGEGAGELPDDGTHLVARALRRGLAECGVESEDLTLLCRNRIPQARGLGSSSAAIVGGLMLARELVVDARGQLDSDALIRIATQMEGHPDNVAPAVLRGLTIAWVADGIGRAVAKEPHPSLRAVAFVPETRLATSAARGLLPDMVPMSDATFNLARTALLVEAATARPDLLFEATEDRLHQCYRRDAYPSSWELVESLRAAGHAAFVSGAGPTVVVLCGATEAASVAERGSGSSGFDARIVDFARGGSRD